MNNLIKLFVLLILLYVTNLLLNAQNYLSIQGNKLFNSIGSEVRLTGVNWFGFETSNLHVHGIWSRDTRSMLQQIKDQGFNCIRIPWCNKIMEPSASLSINAYGTDPYTGVSPMNEYESTLNHPLELLDVIVQWCQENNMKIIFDNHSRQPDGYMNEILWYTDKTPESKWISDWVALTKRYKDYDAVIGMDLNNEPHGKYEGGATWGNSSPATDWNKAAERCGNAILEVNPNVLILVEGIEMYQDDVYWWGGNLSGVADYPIQLSHPEKLLYSPHEYGPTVYNQPWFSDPDFPDNMPEIWEKHFNFIHTREISHLLVGEFGLRDPDGVDEIWFDTFMAYMGEKGYSWTFWCWNPNSGDTGGLLDDEWIDIVEWKMAKLRPYLAPEIPNGEAGNGAPKAKISANPLSGIVSLKVSFDASQSNDPDGDVITYAWDFGDGNTAIGVTASHTYTTEGAYTVKLTVSDGSLNNVAYQNITVRATDVPVTGISVSPVSDSISVGASTILTASITPSNATDQSVSWSSADTSVATVNASGVVTGISEGKAIVSVVTNDGGWTATATVIVSAGFQPCDNPVAVSLDFSYSGSGEYCWVIIGDIEKVSSWNTNSVEINGIDYTNKWSNQMPAKIDGKYYISYSGDLSWSHFEASKKNGNTKSGQLNNIEIYPNHLKEQALTITGADKIRGAKVSIYNISGQVVYEGTLNSGKTELNRVLFPHTGLFFVKISQQTNIRINKIMVE